MNIYLAASYARKAEMRVHRTSLEMLEHFVTSRWLDEATKDDGIAAAKDNAENQYLALTDVADIRDADCMICFTEPTPSPRSRGGRHVEMGLFLGLMLAEPFDRRLMVVGAAENIFHAMPQVERFESWQECLAEIRKGKPRGENRLAAIDQLAARTFG